MNLRKDRRKDKRYLNWIRKKAGYGKYILDCRGHPSRVTSAGKFSPGCDLISLLDDTTWCCSYNNCGPEPIPEHIARSIKEPILTQEQYDAYIGIMYEKKR